MTRWTDDRDDAAAKRPPLGIFARQVRFARPETAMAVSGLAHGKESAIADSDLAQ
jgi:hypothetical protein